MEAQKLGHQVQQPRTHLRSKMMLLEALVFMLTTHMLNAIIYRTIVTTEEVVRSTVSDQNNSSCCYRISEDV